MNILGKGINAIEVDLLNLNHEKQSGNIMKNISLAKIVLGKYQPRKHGKISKESLQDLVESIKEQGVLQPIIVREMDDEKYELIAGERRYLSALEIGLTVIPCLIKNVNEREAFAIALIENIQREQLTLLEESESLLKLKDEHFLSVDQVSKIIGKPRSTVANLIRVASLLSPECKLFWENGDVDYGHIRAAIILDHKFQNIVIQYVIDKKLSVRETEKFIKEKKYLDLLEPQVTKINNRPLVSSDDMKILSEKFLNLYNKNVRINALKTGRIRVLMEFESIERIYDYLDIEN
ncbi:TPA: ParB/RepB/Spo0J family partition protein [Legionella pneumophila subsp. pneumophila]|jgi:ParB family chromosome partitioning protein|uniref:ParB/RepB/Spo0J family partition protein n=2 Tax=Legionella TaxID=445 RepID=A0ABS1W7D4_9GAMM|nr:MULTISPECIES: ParB/RepB/Spo0J family partition protein [Legionella]HAT9067743.1 ParB/RepB/Spo0J family partition protein [Legionella pneumophila subsp. pneumophila]KTD39644.1 chromosome partitioning protein ParB [Legionella moravica]MBL7478511.1 ParB/RepB/Spo0J family partition protein [Legionella bononiensis]MBL7525278.1 ParB/RepB/Spo0J family partition protein [Legionella bononiensis]MBL7561468.1 ParB/RepB/Spo0J family partition protein [Legionella bononiensis]